MKKQKSPDKLNSLLRQRAEEYLEKGLAKTKQVFSEVDAMKLIHELEVHQVELEMQNEELELAKAREAEYAAGKYEELYDFAPTGYFTLSKEGIITKVNLRGSTLLGRERLCLVNSRFDSFVSPEARMDFLHFLDKIFGSKARQTCEISLSADHDSIIYVLLTAQVSENREECLLTASDISEFKLAEQKIRESERFLKEVQSITSLGTFSINLKTMKWESSEMLDVIMGIDAGFDRTLKGWVSTLHPDWVQQLKGYFHAEVDGNKKKFDKEYKIIRQTDQAERWVHGMSRLEFDRYGQAEKIVGTVRDITERVQSEEALRHSEEQLSLALGGAEMGRWHFNIKTMQGTLDLKDIQILGYSHKVTISDRASWVNLTHAEDITLAEKRLADYLTGQTPLFETEHRMLNASGEYHWVSVRGKITAYDKDGSPLMISGTFLDIAKHKLAEQALVESELKYRLLVENANEAIYVVQNGAIVFANKVCGLITGIPSSGLIGLSVFDLVDARDREPLVNHHRGLINGTLQSHNSQFSIRNKTGEERWLSVNSVRIIWEGLPATLNMATDITERKYHEVQLQIYSDELKKQIAEKDKFFSIVAHDLRGPFNIFLGFTEIMAYGLNEMTLAEIQNIATVIRNSAVNLYSLLGNLLEWSRLQRGLFAFNPSIYPLMPRISENMQMVMEAARKKEISISYDVPEKLEVLADGNMLGGIIRNLATNAVKYTPRGGCILISAEKNSDHAVEISVRDTGIGMDAEMLAGLFRLDSVSNRTGTEGEPTTGLGLILCKDFVEKHGGKLWAESETGKGSTFRFTLPGAAKAEGEIKNLVEG